MSDRDGVRLALERAGVTIDHREILRHIDLQVPRGELLVILGNTDSGKSTLLRAIAGLDPLSSGELHIDGADVRRLRTEWRGAAMMMQNFPLWPNRSVSGNVAFGLEQQRMKRSVRKLRIQHALARVGMLDFRRHWPWQLSDSQRQRVALARTLAAGARLNLLDEPFSTQDEQHRRGLAQMLKQLHQDQETTTLIAARDGQALVPIADRVAVLHDGRMQQLGTPQALYDTPSNRVVAETMGRANLIEGETEHVGEQTLFRAAGDLVIPLFDGALVRPRKGTAFFRPHDLRPVCEEQATRENQVCFSGRVDHVEFLGGVIRYALKTGDIKLWMDQARSDDPQMPRVGQQIMVGLAPEKIRILDA